MAALASREARRDELMHAITGTETLRRVASVDRGVLAASVRERLSDWCGLASRSVEQSRQILRKLLVGPLVCTPIQREGETRLQFEGDLSLGRLIGGVIALPTNVASPTGLVASQRLPMAGFYDRRAA